MRNSTARAAHFNQAAHFGTPLDDSSNAESRCATKDYFLKTIADLFEHSTFLTFRSIRECTGLSKSEVIQLKLLLEARLQRDITSRIDLPEPGFFLED